LPKIAKVFLPKMCKFTKNLLIFGKIYQFLLKNIENDEIYQNFIKNWLIYLFTHFF